jgi:hypothetical protein
MPKLLTRHDLREVLLRWQAGDVDPRFVFDWATERYAGKGWDTEDEIVDQVLLELYSLDMNLTTAEDVPHLLKLLAIPRGQIGTAKALQRDYARSVPIQARRVALAKDPLYGPHCKLAK